MMPNIRRPWPTYPLTLTQTDRGETGLCLLDQLLDGGHLIHVLAEEELQQVCQQDLPPHVFGQDVGQVRHHCVRLHQQLSRSFKYLNNSQAGYNNDNNNNDHIQRCNLSFYNLLTAPQTFSNTYTEVARVQSHANHVQHIEHLSCATCVPRGAKGQFSY